ncbi:hypothetical protein RFI_32847 [Reticulomyxa filosa]|uniref:Dynein heavy chain linker domain-containing protein n=1 Tax=Reticulomyxa filosa TaxID=46433 RepID=X6LUZ7_RETFI|nr:hypothetical protein RFI_32847 [Reticulomyxa filosa]|eukprot:ETO04550.1 hypothetical protein RFI_32847 [Reticulomyxa filosa]
MGKKFFFDKGLACFKKKIILFILHNNTQAKNNLNGTKWKIQEGDEIKYRYYIRVGLHSNNSITNVSVLCSLPAMFDQLERCQKALTEFLEEKREKFLRFYFLGDDLLEIVKHLIILFFIFSSIISSMLW